VKYIKFKWNKSNVRPHAWLYSFVLRPYKTQKEDLMGLGYDLSDLGYRFQLTG
jgi:hypothetical protein